jgi:hypothetical protein
LNTSSAQTATSLEAPIDACHGSDHALSGIADSSAAFGVGMTKMDVFGFKPTELEASPNAAFQQTLQPS